MHAGWARRYRRSMTHQAAAKAVHEASPEPSKSSTKRLGAGAAHVTLVSQCCCCLWWWWWRWRCCCCWWWVMLLLLLVDVGGGGGCSSGGCFNRCYCFRLFANLVVVMVLLLVLLLVAAVFVGCCCCCCCRCFCCVFFCCWLVLVDAADADAAASAVDAVLPLHIVTRSL